MRPLAVKRWESGARPVPDDALEWALEAAAMHDAAVEELVAEARENARRREAVVLPYYRTQEQHDRACDDGRTYLFANAASRAAGEILKGDYQVLFAYPD